MAGANEVWGRGVDIGGGRRGGTMSSRSGGWIANFGGMNDIVVVGDRSIDEDWSDSAGVANTVKGSKAVGELCCRRCG